MEFRQFDANDYDATRKKWLEESVQYDCFPAEVEGKFDPVKAWLDGAGADEPHRTVHYGVFQPGQNIAVAHCEMVLSNKGSRAEKWLKLIKLTLSPEVDTLQLQEDMAAIQTAVKAYRTAVLGSFAERAAHDADTLKIYGRNEEQLRLLIQMMSLINEDQAAGLSATKEGRWLVLRCAAKQE